MNLHDSYMSLWHLDMKCYLQHSKRIYLWLMTVILTPCLTSSQQDVPHKTIQPYCPITATNLWMWLPDRQMFKLLKMVLSKTQVYWNVVLYHWVTIFGILKDHNVSSGSTHLLKYWSAIESWATLHPGMKHLMPEDLHCLHPINWHALLFVFLR
jgi:hypothetical protein